MMDYFAVEGGRPLEGRVFVHGAKNSALPLLAATLLADGESVLHNCPDLTDISAALGILSGLGCRVRREGATVMVDPTCRRGPLGGVGSLCTGPYPAFPTDAQPLLAAALAGGTGKSRITETIFDRRFRYTEGLCAMGAAIQVEGDTAYILGRPLHGAQVAATDLRGGAALTVAALGAQGPSRIWGLDHVDRGYEGLETALAALGGNIRRETGP